MSNTGMRPLGSGDLKPKKPAPKPQEPAQESRAETIWSLKPASAIPVFQGVPPVKPGSAAAPAEEWTDESLQPDTAAPEAREEVPAAAEVPEETPEETAGWDMPAEEPGQSEGENTEKMKESEQAEMAEADGQTEEPEQTEITEETEAADEPGQAEAAEADETAEENAEETAEETAEKSAETGMPEEAKKPEKPEDAEQAESPADTARDPLAAAMEDIAAFTDGEDEDEDEDWTEEGEDAVPSEAMPEPEPVAPQLPGLAELAPKKRVWPVLLLTLLILLAVVFIVLVLARYDILPVAQLLPEKLMALLTRLLP